MPLAAPTARRLAYHKDGSQVFEYNPATGVSYQYTTAQMKQLNSDMGSAVFSTGSSGVPDTGGSLWEIIFFPASRDIQALRYWMQADNSNSSQMFYSTDTTGPGTGTWTGISGTDTTPNHTNSILNVGIQYRSPIAATIAGVRAIMVPWATRNNFAWIGQVHVWGTRSASDTNRQVAFTNASGTRFTKDQDLGDVGIGLSAKWKTPNDFNEPDQCYLKNFSGTQTANSVVVGIEANADDIGQPTTIVGETLFSLDDITYTSTVTITSIASGAVAGPIYVKYTTLTSDPINGQIGLTTITVGSWT